jgi:hypothetical protein
MGIARRFALDLQVILGPLRACQRPFAFSAERITLGAAAGADFSFTYKAAARMASIASLRDSCGAGIAWPPESRGKGIVEPPESRGKGIVEPPESRGKLQCPLKVFPLHF